MNIRPTVLAVVLSFSILSLPVCAGPEWGGQSGDWKKPSEPMKPMQPGGWKQGPGAGTRTNALLSGSENANRTNKLTSEINWHRSVGQAETTAAQQGKMILWVNLLGTMSGGT